MASEAEPGPETESIEAVVREFEKAEDSRAGDHHAAPETPLAAATGASPMLRKAVATSVQQLSVALEDSISDSVQHLAEALSRLSSRVADVEDGLRTRLQQVEDDLAARVSEAEEKLTSQLTDIDELGERLVELEETVQRRSTPADLSADAATDESAVAPPFDAAAAADELGKRLAAVEEWQRFEADAASDELGKRVAEVEETVQRLMADAGARKDSASGDSAGATNLDAAVSELREKLSLQLTDIDELGERLLELEEQQPKLLRQLEDLQQSEAEHSERCAELRSGLGALQAQLAEFCAGEQTMVAPSPPVETTAPADGLEERLRSVEKQLKDLHREVTRQRQDAPSQGEQERLKEGLERVEASLAEGKSQMQEMLALLQSRLQQEGPSPRESSEEPQEGGVKHQEKVVNDPAQDPFSPLTELRRTLLTLEQQRQRQPQKPHPRAKKASQAQLEMAPRHDPATKQMESLPPVLSDRGLQHHRSLPALPVDSNMSAQMQSMLARLQEQSDLSALDTCLRNRKAIDVLSRATNLLRGKLAHIADPVSESNTRRHGGRGPLGEDVLLSGGRLPSQGVAAQGMPSAAPLSSKRSANSHVSRRRGEVLE